MAGYVEQLGTTVTWAAESCEPATTATANCLKFIFLLIYVILLYSVFVSTTLNETTFLTTL